MGLAKVTRNFQVTIPKDVRELEGIRIGDMIIFSIEEGRIELLKMRKELVGQVFGSWGKGESGLATVRRIRKASERRMSRIGI